MAILDHFSGPQKLVLFVVGWILIIIIAAAVGYAPTPRSTEPERTNNDPKSPCYGLTARECKWN
jgi:hypothetical protein